MLAMTFTDLNQYSKFFHDSKEEQMFNKLQYMSNMLLSCLCFCHITDRTKPKNTDANATTNQNS